ncbi:ankyrin repeat and KH domain-containing protein mask-like [Pecten maximus]|uniref:ankyrin repeat and KH domain-containing protein mask-like n=1 Tax=Pecten maximus TaxID=6579 RepID=UPI001458CBEB|nr:ankyrin repeat and KH domain-containing protein mask-like [Pecten maximus]
MDQADGSTSEDGSGEINNETDTSPETAVSEGITDQTCNGQSDAHVPDENNQPDSLVRASCNQPRQTGYDVESASSVAPHGTDDVGTLESQPEHVLLNGSSNLVADVENGAGILGSEHYVTGETAGEVGPVEERVSYILNSTSGPVDGTVDVRSVIASVAQRNLYSEDSAVNLSENNNKDGQCFIPDEKFSENQNLSPAQAASVADSAEYVTQDVCSSDLLTPEVGSTQQTSSEVGGTLQTPAEVESAQQTPAEVESAHQTPAEVENAQQTPAEVGGTQQTSAEVERTQQTPAEAGGTQQAPAEVGGIQQTSADVDSEGIINFRKVVQEFLDGIKDQVPTEEPPDTTESLAAFVQENIASKNIRTIKYTLKDLTEADRKAVVEYEIDGKTAFFVACEKGTDETVKYFVAECGADINKKGRFDCGGKDMLVAPLWLATIEEKPEVVKILASHGADVNAVCTTGSTAVHAACYMNNTELVEALCNSGSDVNIPDTLGSTCLKDSVDNLEICKILIAHGADVNYKKENQYSILHHAIKAHNMETVELLVRNGADIMTTDFEGKRLFEICYSSLLPRYRGVFNG